jgi:hypothetical protein
MIYIALSHRSRIPHSGIEYLGLNQNAHTHYLPYVNGIEFQEVSQCLAERYYLPINNGIEF